MSKSEEVQERSARLNHAVFDLLNYEAQLVKILSSSLVRLHNALSEEDRNPNLENTMQKALEKFDYIQEVIKLATLVNSRELGGMPDPIAELFEVDELIEDIHKIAETFILTGKLS